jgi:hypothetical protein
VVIHLGNKPWHNLSWLWDVIASVVFQSAKSTGLVLFAVACGLFAVACGAVIVGCLTFVCLGSGASATAVSIAVFSA